MPLATGQILNNRYRIVSLLGQGGFGAVYRAWDTVLQRPAALKENLDVSPEAQRQFQREARLLANLEHPNLPRVTDHFLLPGQGQYLVMDFVEGEDLQALLEKAGGPLPEKQVLPWIIQVCEALDYVHSQSPPVIHRDIKPANIKITPQGKAKLVDFGIAKVYDPKLRTTVGARAVTPGYSPPEQYGRGATEARSDIYALGATLYHLLTGQIPPDSVDVITHNTTAPLPAEGLNPAVSPVVSAAVEQAMRLERSERWENARQFKEALTLTPSPPPERGRDRVGVKGGTVALAYSPGRLPTQVMPEAQARLSLNAPAAQPVSKTRCFSLAALMGGGALLLVLCAVGIVGIIRLITLAPPTSSPPVSETAALTSEAIVRFPPSATQNLPIASSATQNPPTTSTAAQHPTPTPDPGGDIPMALIPAGEFLMGSADADAQAGSDEKPQHRVSLEAYSMDVYEVTNARYARCVEAGACGKPDCNYFDDPAFADHPVVCVAWSQAQAYCEWRGKNLPTEAQWEKAARGGLQGTRYPWGDEDPVCDQGADNGAQSSSCGGQTGPVGSFSPNGYGLFDMAGNIWEWVWDWYQDTFYSGSPTSNPTGPDGGSSRVLRGGSWFDPWGNLRVANRRYVDPGHRAVDLGFRCALSPGR